MRIALAEPVITTGVDCVSSIVHADELIGRSIFLTDNDNPSRLSVYVNIIVIANMRSLINIKVLGRTRILAASDERTCKLVAVS